MEASYKMRYPEGRGIGDFSIFGHSLLQVLGSRLYNSKGFRFLLGFGFLKRYEF